VPQDIVRISQAIASGEFFRLPPLVELCSKLKRRGGTLHLLGLIGNGGVHALDQHLVPPSRSRICTSCRSRFMPGSTARHAAAVALAFMQEWWTCSRRTAVRWWFHVVAAITR